MYGLNHKLKKVTKKEQYSEAKRTQKKKLCWFGFSLLLSMLLGFVFFSLNEKCAYPDPLEPTAQFWCLVWPLHYLACGWVGGKML